MSSLTEIKLPEMVEIWSVKLWKLSSSSDTNPPSLSFLFTAEADTKWIERLTPPKYRFENITIKVVSEIVEKNSKQHSQAIGNSTSVLSGSLNLTFFQTLQKILWDIAQVFDELDIVDPDDEEE